MDRAKLVGIFLAGAVTGALPGAVLTANAQEPASTLVVQNLQLTKTSDFPDGGTHWIGRTCAIETRADGGRSEPCWDAEFGDLSGLTKQLIDQRP